MRAALVFQSMLRESRGARGRLAFFLVCLAIGVAAVVGVDSLVTSIAGGIRAQSRQLLAADLAVSGQRPLPKELDAFFENTPGVERTEVRELATMASVPREATDAASGIGPSRLVELKVIDGRYPLYGELVLSPRAHLSELLDERTAVVGPELLDALQVHVGDDLDLGGARFRIAGVVLEEPDRLDFSLTLGPRVFLDARGLARTTLASFGSRIRHRALFRLPPDVTSKQLDRMKHRLASQLPGAEYLHIETHDEAQPTVRRSLERVQHYLGLVALLSLILGGTGVAQIVRAWLASKTTSIAVLRCLGFRPREILVLYLSNVALLALAGSVLGGLAGSLLPLIAPHFARGVLPSTIVPSWQPFALVRGIAIGLAIALLFSLPPLTAIWRVSPARVLRSEVEPLPPNVYVRWCATLVLALGVLASAWIQGGSFVLALEFTSGLALLSALLFGAARGVVALVSRLPRARLNPYLLHGVSALARPGAGTIGAIVALGLGVMVVLSMWLVERGLVDQLRTALPENAPSVFLVDIQPDQWIGVRALLESEHAEHVDVVPVVTARLTSIDGRSVESIANKGARTGDRSQDDGRSRWGLTREQRLTWLDRLPADNRIVEGSLWNDPEHAEVSLEERFARDLGAKLGSTLRFDVQGTPIDLRVTSLRSVEWQSFAINFFLVAEPGVLDEAPHFMLATARVPKDDEAHLQDRLAAQFPNVTLLRVRSILDKILGVLQRLAFGVRLLGSFTIFVGIAIQAGVVSSTALHRGREAALLKTLGVTRSGVAALLATEFALCGLVAGLIGGSGAIVLAWAFLEHVVEVKAGFAIGALPIAALAAAAIAAVCGIAASGRALAVRPIESLRG